MVPSATPRSVRAKRPRSPSPASATSTLSDSANSSQRTKQAAFDSPSKAKKLKLQATYTEESPFPDYAHPTAAEAQEVFDILSHAHRKPGQALLRKPPQAGSNAAQTCGNVPNVIEALIGTVLSQNTSAQNCTRAKNALDATFGRNNFAAVAAAPHADVAAAIHSGGLANKKAAAIQNILRAVRERHGAYSLQHLAATAPGTRMSDAEIMQELVSYDGVGPKTASCVLLFCLGRDSFAVDTHVFRLSKVLAWVPAKANRITAQAHLDLRIPDELKYGLHVLMIQHGRVCKGCKKPGAKEACILKSYLRDRKGQKQSDIDTKLELVKEEDDNTPRLKEEDVEDATLVKGEKAETTKVKDEIVA